MNNRIVYLGNLHALATAVDALATDGVDGSGLCVIYGPAGIGKTWALRHVAGKLGALSCTALPFWTPHAMLTTLSVALAEPVLARTSALFDRLARTLGASPRPVMIDEADRVADRPILLETLRILHDLTGAPLVLAGMDETRRTIARRPQLRRRVLHEVEFAPLSPDEAHKVATERSQVPLADDLIEELWRRSGGIIGLFCQALTKSERYARRRNAETSFAQNQGATPPITAPLTLHEYCKQLAPPVEGRRKSHAAANVTKVVARRVA